MQAMPTAHTPSPFQSQPASRQSVPTQHDLPQSFEPQPTYRAVTSPHHQSVLIRNLILQHFRGHINDLLGRPLLRRPTTTRHQFRGRRQPRNRAHLPAGWHGRHRDTDVLRAAGDHLGVEAGDVDALGLVLIRGGEDLDDLVPRELELGNVHGAAVHEVGVEDAQDRLVRDDEEVVLLALELEDDWLEADGEVVVGLGDALDWGN